MIVLFAKTGANLLIFCLSAKQNAQNQTFCAQNKQFVQVFIRPFKRRKQRVYNNKNDR